MATVELAPEAVEQADHLIVTHSLPPDTWRRVIRSLRSLEAFPLIGRELEGQWAGTRLQDARSGTSSTSP